jgi:hypothetical protein
MTLLRKMYFIPLIARASFEARYQPFNDLTTPAKVDLL